MKIVLQILHDVTSAIAIHLIAMLVCTFVTLALLGGKTPYEIFPLIFGIYVPFFAAGWLVVKQKIRCPRIISPLSAGFALLILAAIIAWYRDGDWSAAQELWFTVPAIGCSLWGVHYALTPPYGSDAVNKES